MQPNTLTAPQAEEIVNALQRQPGPSLEWLEEKLPGITQELVEHLLDTAYKIKYIMDHP